MSEASVTRPVTTTSAPAVEAVDDAACAEVGVGGQRAARARVGSARDEQVVALDVGHGDRDAESVGQRADRLGQARRG